MTVRLISSFVGIAVALLVLFLNQTFLFPLALACVIGIILSELAKAVDIYYSNTDRESQAKSA